MVQAWLPDHVDASENGYVDHQSIIHFPRNWNGNGIDKEFFDEFKSFLLRDDVAILGANDNDGSIHPLRSAGIDTMHKNVLPIETDEAYVVRKDPSGFWTMFSRENGSKIRFSFCGGALEKHPDRSARPELVDIKITDYCPFGCSYCYQDSTVDGKHATLNDIQSFAYVLGNEMRVFEVALGGGEPTLHPDFVDILRAFRRHGVVPNFTTKTLKWLSSPLARDIMESAGAFAYSCETSADVNTLFAECEKAGLVTEGYMSHRVVVQHVMGTDASMEAFRDLVSACFEKRIQLTLLGYKTAGRGKSLMAKPYENWFQIVAECAKKHYVRKVGIDTALAHESMATMRKAGISPELFSTSEGAFSMYIDAVAKTFGPSSYHTSLIRPFGEADYSWRVSVKEIDEAYTSTGFAVAGMPGTVGYEILAGV